MTSRRDFLKSFTEDADCSMPCHLCGSVGGSHGVVPGSEALIPVITVCRACIEVLYDVTHTHDHCLDDFRECPVCAALRRSLGDTRKIIPCRFRRVLCHHRGLRCQRDAIVDIGFKRLHAPRVGAPLLPSVDLMRLPPGWAVYEMEAMVDYQRYICPPCLDEVSG